MNVYLDASVLLPIIIAETGSPAVDRFIRSVSSGLLVSEFAIAEVSSALSRLTRTRTLALEEARAKLADFDVWRATQAKLVDIEGADVRLAGVLVRRFELKLGAPDALHLAICRRLDAPLVTLDRKLAEAAANLDIAATLLL